MEGDDVVAMQVGYQEVLACRVHSEMARMLAVGGNAAGWLKLGGIFVPSENRYAVMTSIRSVDVSAVWRHDDLRASGLFLKGVWQRGYGLLQG